MKPLWNVSGFTLLEAVVALAIVSLVATASLATVGTELRAASKGRLSLQATVLAEERLAALMLAETAELESLQDSLESGRFSAPFDDYQWNASAERVRNKGDLFEIAVMVESSLVSRRLVTRIFRPPVELFTP